MPGKDDTLQLPATEDEGDLSRSTVRGARRIYFRFTIIVLSINALFSAAILVFEVLGTVRQTEQRLSEMAELQVNTVHNLRRARPSWTPRQVIARATRLTGAPMALMTAGAGRPIYTSSPQLALELKRIYKTPADLRAGLRLLINTELGALSGAWRLVPFDGNYLLIVIPHRPEDEGHFQYLTIQAGILFLGLALLFFVMAFAARWLFYQPVHRLVGQLTGALARDVERRRRAEEKATAARFEAEEHLTFRNNLLDASEAVGIIATDVNGVVRIFNSAAEQILGYAERDVVGRRTLADLRELAGRDATWELPLRTLMQLEQGEEFRVDASGQEHLLSINESEIRDSTGQYSGQLVTFIDISERKRLEAELQLNELQLIQSAKMATLGEMATGVAHELNQPLNNIGLLTSRVRRRLRKLPAGEDATFVNEKLERIQGQVQRASRIIEQLRSFGRRSGAEDFQPVVLADAVHQVVDMLGEQFRHHSITLEIDLPADLPRVRADRGQLEQVLVNLVVNARDALRDGAANWQPPDEKRVSITGHVCDIEGKPAAAVQVADNGPGIPADVQEKVFQPFFTTKEVGQGTGLGLSISYSLIQGFGGTLTVESEPGKDTAFTITLLQVTSTDGSKKQDSAGR